MKDLSSCQPEEVAYSRSNRLLIYIQVAGSVRIKRRVFFDARVSPTKTDGYLARILLQQQSTFEYEFYRLRGAL